MSTANFFFLTSFLVYAVGSFYKHGFFAGFFDTLGVGLLCVLAIQVGLGHDQR